MCWVSNSSLAGSTPLYLLNSLVSHDMTKSIDLFKVSMFLSCVSYLQYLESLFCCMGFLMLVVIYGLINVKWGLCWYKHSIKNRVWWHTPLIPALRRQRLADF